MASHSDEKCLFCNIIAGKIPSVKVYETDNVFAFLDINPVSEGHTLVIPKYHAVTIADLPEEHMVGLLPAAKKIALATGAQNYHIIQNNGKLAYQTVDHVHFHVVPKTSEKDGLIIDIGVNWPVQKVEKEQLIAVGEKIKSRL